MDDQSSMTIPAKPSKFAEIPLNQIDDPARPMRSDLDRENLDDLVRSIKQVGIIEPIIVRAKGDRYEVIAGHRRTVAAEYAGLAVAPCRVVEANDDETEMMKIHENLYRLDISPQDEAQHYAYLVRERKLSPTQVARLINRSTKYVTDRLDILEYHPELLRALDQELINFSVAKEFHRIEDEGKLRQYLGYAIRNGITAAGAKKWVDELTRPVVPDQPFTQPPADSGDFTPAQEQATECFYCLQPVKLLEAPIVYVHDHCLNARREQAQEPAEEPTSVVD